MNRINFVRTVSLVTLLAILAVLAAGCGPSDPKESILQDRARWNVSVLSWSQSDDGTVTIESYEPERISMRTVGSRAALVVLTDAFYPGWRATVDGENTPILRANLNFRGIAVPAGEHVIEMRYAPSSLRLGFALASIGAAGAALAWRRGGGDRQTMRDVRSPQ